MEREWVVNADIELGNMSIDNAIAMEELSYMQNGRMRAIKNLLSEFVFDTNEENPAPTLDEKLAWLGQKSVNELMTMMNQIMADLPKYVEKKQKRK